MVAFAATGCAVSIYTYLVIATGCIYKGAIQIGFYAATFSRQIMQTVSPSSLG
jgi:hypothetical protein